MNAISQHYDTRGCGVLVGLKCIFPRVGVNLTGPETTKKCIKCLKAKNVKQPLGNNENKMRKTVCIETLSPIGLYELSYGHLLTMVQQFDNMSYIFGRLIPSSPNFARFSSS